MIEQAPLYVRIIVWVMETTMIAGVVVMFIGFPLFAWYLWKKHKRDQEDGESDEGEGGWGGGGGWTDKPSGKPPGGGGPDRDIDKMFHEVCDAIGKTIKIEKKDKDKVLL
jgi:hypothetical protein